ncbi:GNAT family N-acetyltransferase [Sphaerothrix gracilis]|uniref:GNAT family N-acetyltransferase n=1 Tax=Sphaerothrix gracilis TaxID=3151835 RepID=UPI0031FD0FBE
MNNPTGFALKRPGYFARRLTLQDADILQRLYEQCTAFFHLTDGLSPAPTAAREEFDDLPAGKTSADNYIFGLFNAQQELAGMIAGIRHYPDAQTWWIGLMMVAPEYRGRGLGADFYRAFERWVEAQGISKISLVAIEANERGLQFWLRMGFKIMRKTPPRQYKAKTHAVYVLSQTVERISPALI